MVESTPSQADDQQKKDNLKAQLAVMTPEERKRLAAAALKQAMSDPNSKGKNKLYEVIKALSAMRLTKDDGVPNPVLTFNKSDNSLALATMPMQEAFLYQGSVGAAYNQKELLSAGITHILTCAGNIGQRFPKGFRYETLNLLDTPTQNIMMHFDKAHEFINECRNKNGRILVHCFAGKSRASTITCSYLMKEMQIDLKTSLDHLQKQRPIAQPNIGFLIQLKQYEKDLFGKCSDVPLLIPKSTKEKAREAAAGGGNKEEVVQHDVEIDSENLIKSLKTAEQLEAEGMGIASEAKQMDDAKELMSEETKAEIGKQEAKLSN